MSFSMFGKYVIHSTSRHLYVAILPKVFAIAAEIEALKDSIKAEMIRRDVEELEAGRFIARFTSVSSNRFDTTAFKREHGEMYKLYTKQTTSRRFSIA